MKRLKTLLILLPLITATSCNKDTVPDPSTEYVKYVPAPCSDTDTVFYDAEIRAQIIDQSCNVSGCHDATAAGELKYTNHAEVSAMTHPMYLAIIHDTAVTSMPIGQERLPDSLLNKFYCWIQQGRLDN